MTATLAPAALEQHTERRTVVRRNVDRVTPDVVVERVVDELQPLIDSGNPELILIAHNIARQLRMLQR